mmetsp:Transcript_3832/g.11510  ORF Transcript_3832/g.11510 Transcript_3832/m.11510 type:complete len:83 (+) Transcript_3832:170-418(+)
MALPVVLRPGTRHFGEGGGPWFTCAWRRCYGWLVRCGVSGKMRGVSHRTRFKLVALPFLLLVVALLSSRRIRRSRVALLRAS